MGYYLSAFFGKTEELRKIQKTYKSANLIELHPCVSLIPLTEDLFDEINNFSATECLFNFEYLTTKSEDEILTMVTDITLAYVEAEYFGGQGGQSAIIWKNGKRDSEFIRDSQSINKVLKSFGVIAEANKDEFDTVGLSRHRHTRDWLES